MQISDHHFRAFSILMLLTMGASHLATAQVTVDTTWTMSALVNEIMLGQGTVVSNITYNGEPAENYISPHSGYFTTENSPFPIAEGVVMSSGRADRLAQPTLGNITFENFQNDPDMQQIAGINVNNCGILEFDFVADSTLFAIDYIFASEEYPQFTCSQFNDPFGIFLSGPGLSGPFTNNAQNIATIPGTDTPVAINTINYGPTIPPNFPNPCAQANPNYQNDSIYFINNSPILENNIWMPGHTVLMTAQAALVQGETYHCKIGIANAMDQGFPSAALLRRSSVYHTTEKVPKVEIIVYVNEINVHPSGLHIAGNFTQSMKMAMDLADDGTYVYQFNRPAFSNVWYKIYNGTSDASAEIIPNSCTIQASTGASARHLMIEPVAEISEYICFGTCESCLPTATSDVSQTKVGFPIYPNPNKGAFQIVPPLDGIAEIVLYDLSGKSVFSTRVYTFEAQAQQIQATELPKGFYIVEMRYVEEKASVPVYTQKMAVQ